MTDPFLPFGPADPTAEVTLFCLPHAGSGASSYRGWARGFPSWVDVRPMQLPGREGRWREPLVDDAATLVADLVHRVESELERPYALYGHSMGGLLAAELTAALIDAGAAPPELLIVSGYSHNLRPVRAHQDEELIDWLRGLGGTDAAVLEDREMREMILPVLRADLTLVATYRATWNVLTVPVLAMGGTNDEIVDASAIADWSIRTTMGAEIVLIDGGHFFNQDRRALVSAHIVEQLVMQGVR